MKNSSPPWTAFLENVQQIEDLWANYTGLQFHHLTQRISVKGWNMKSQSLTGVAAERECEQLQKEFLQVHWQQKEGKGKCGPAAELSDCPGDKERAKIFKALFTLVFTGKKTCTSLKFLCVAGGRLFGEGGLPTVHEDEAEAHWIKLFIYKPWTRWHAFECWGSWSVLLCVHSLWHLKGI